MLAEIEAGLATVRPAETTHLRPRAELVRAYSCRAHHPVSLPGRVLEPDWLTRPGPVLIRAPSLALPPQLPHAGTDRLNIVGSARSANGVSSHPLGQFSGI
jgi:hypothetical protein